MQRIPSEIQHFRESDMCRVVKLASVFFAVLTGLAISSRADDPAKEQSDEVVLTDVDGKETRLTKFRINRGTRVLGWLADPDSGDREGPQAMEVREPNSTTFTKGVLTYVPVASIETVKYDYEKLSVFIHVKGVKEPLLGTLQYRGINTLGITGLSEGKNASFTAGALGKTAIKSVEFPDAKPLAETPGGRTWAIQIVHPAANNPTVKAKNLKVLFQYAGGVQKLLDGLPVRNGAPVPFDAKLARFEMLANDTNTNYAAAAIELEQAKQKSKDDQSGPKGDDVRDKERIIAIPLTADENGKQVGTLAGIVGEVEVGYKFFPLHTIKLIVPFAKKAD
jgi:hypothetical protein